jgi:hypothetical protein
MPKKYNKIFNRFNERKKADSKKIDRDTAIIRHICDNKIQNVTFEKCFIKKSFLLNIFTEKYWIYINYDLFSVMNDSFVAYNKMVSVKSNGNKDYTIHLMSHELYNELIDKIEDATGKTIYEITDDNMGRAVIDKN